MYAHISVYIYIYTYNKKRMSLNEGSQDEDATDVFLEKPLAVTST